MKRRIPSLSPSKENYMISKLKTIKIIKSYNFITVYPSFASEQIVVIKNPDICTDNPKVNKTVKIKRFGVFQKKSNPKHNPEIIMIIVMKKFIVRTVMNQLNQNGFEDKPITLRPCLNFFSFSRRISVTLHMKLIF